MKSSLPNRCLESSSYCFPTILVTNSRQTGHRVFCSKFMFPRQYNFLCWVAMVFCAFSPTVAVDGNSRADGDAIYALPPHLQDGFQSEITLRGAVLHSSPFAIVEEDPLTGKLTARGLQIDLLERLSIFAAQDDIRLNFELHPFQYSPEYTYGTALAWIANDCNATTTSTHGYGCNFFDLIVADYWSTAERYQRVDFTSPWLSNAISAMKYVSGAGDDDHLNKDNDINYRKCTVTTLTEASLSRSDVCVLEGTHSSRVVMNKFHHGPIYYECETDDECFQRLRDGDCCLFSRDELFLKAKEFEEPRYEVTRERFNTQYVVWPMRYDLPPAVAFLLNRWMIKAVGNTTMDQLFYKYFEKEVCPIGTAGKGCTMPCDPDHGASNIHGNCICESIKWTGDDCSIEVEENLNLIPPSMKWVAYILFGINVGVISFCAGWLVIYRKSEQVKASQPFFLMLVLVGCLISSSTLLALIQEDERGVAAPACMAIPWTYSVGFCVTFGTLFAKIRRVYLIFIRKLVYQPSTTTTAASSARFQSMASNSNRSSFSATSQGGSILSVARRNSSVSFLETLMVIGVVTAVDVAILTVWTLSDPLEWERTVTVMDQFGVALESEGRCTSDSWYIFTPLIGALHLCLMATACYLCYKARQIPTTFQEGKYVAIAMASNFQIFLVGVPVAIIAASDPQISFFVRAAIVWMNDLAVVVLIFGNLMFSTYTVNHETIKGDSVREEINKAVGIYSQSAQSVSKGGGGGLMNTGNPIPEFPHSTSFLHSIPDAFGDESDGADEDSQEHGLRGTSVKNSNREQELLETRPKASVGDNGPRLIISSVSMGSENEPVIDPSINKKASPLDSLARRDMISSVSMDSISSDPNRRSSTRSVTFGMAYYSEGNDDGSELVIPIEPIDLPMETGSSSSILQPRGESSAEVPIQRRKSELSLARFSLDSCVQNAPPSRPPRRNSLSSDNGDDSGSFHDNAMKASAVAYGVNHSPTGTTLCSNDPPLQPVRMLSEVDPE